MIFAEKYTIKNYYSGGSEIVDNASLFEVLTHVAKDHADFVGAVLPEDIVWMVLDWKLRVKRRPKNGEICTVRTWSLGWNRAFANRCYDIIDEQGCVCVEASSRWALANLKTRRIFRLTDELMEGYEPEKGVRDIENQAFMKNISRHAVFVRSSEAKIEDNFIDQNRHVHNTVYSTLAESVLPSGANTDAVDISYRKEIESGEKMILNYCHYNGKNLVLIKTDSNAEPNAIILFEEPSPVLKINDCGDNY